MTTSLPLRPLVRLTVLVAMTLVALAAPVATLGHAELDTSDPAEGSTVEAPFAGPITMTFTEELAAESGAELVDSTGDLPATTALDGMTMTLTPDAALAEGDYEIRWTSAADDGHIERGTIRFTVTPTVVSAPEMVPRP